MTVAISTVRNLLRQLFVDQNTSGYSTVIVAKQTDMNGINTPKPSLPWAEIDMNIQYRPVGMFDEANFDDDMVKITQVREIDVEFNSYGPNAFDAVRQVMDSLHFPSVYELLYLTNNIGIPNRHLIQCMDLTELEDQRYVERGFLSFTIYTSEDVLDDVGYFDEVEINSTYNLLKPDNLDPLNSFGINGVVGMGVILPPAPFNLTALLATLSCLIRDENDNFVINEDGDYITRDKGDSPVLTIYDVVYVSDRASSKDQIYKIKSDATGDGLFIAAGSSLNVRYPTLNKLNNTIGYIDTNAGNTIATIKTDTFPTLTSPTTILTGTGAYALMCCLTYSNDGLYFAFSGRTAIGTFDLFKVEISSGTVTPLATVGGISELSVAWSNDDTKLVFYNSSSLDIFEINADGTGLTNLTPVVGTGTNSTPSYSQDGLKIIFTSTRTDAIGQIWEMDNDGIGSNPARIITSALPNFEPKVTWDNKIIYTENNGGNLRVKKANIDGSDAGILINSSGSDFEGFGGIFSS